MTTQFFDNTKRGLVLTITEAYERVHGCINGRTYEKVHKRLMQLPKARLERLVEYLENSNCPKVDTAYVIAVGTGVFLNCK